VLQKGVLQPIEGKPSGDRRVIALHGAEGVRPTRPAAVPPATTPASSDCPFDYLRFDYFDNGLPPASGRKKRARHVVNVFAATHGSRSRGADYRISFLSEGRFFKRSVPDGVNGGMAHEFYHRIWAMFEELRSHEASEPSGAQIYIGHWKDQNNHVVPYAAAILMVAPEQHPMLIARFGDWRQAIDIDKPAKGSRKCRSLVGLGYARISGRKCT
jgi:hypothetical protein